MHTLIPLIGIVVLLAILFAVTVALKFNGLREQKPNVATSTYEARKCLLTPAENSFFRVLEQAVGNDYRLFAKVRLADIIRPTQSANRSSFQTALNRITSKHVDFVICDLNSLAVLGAVELDDKSHDRLERGVRDGFLDAALGQAGVPIIHVRAASTYLANDLSSQIFNALQPKKTLK